MATTHRSDLTTEIEKALTDEAYDGGSGALSEEQFSRYVRRLAEAAVEVVDQERAIDQQSEPGDAQVREILRQALRERGEGTVYADTLAGYLTRALRAAGGGDDA